MDLTQIIGFVAGFGTTFAALPDLIAMLRRRSSVGMNPRMAAILGTFQILWVIYGALIGSVNIVMWNVIAMSPIISRLGHTRTFVVTGGCREHMQRRHVARTSHNVRGDRDTPLFWTSHSSSMPKSKVCVAAPLRTAAN
jgi:MtN3 and saliva related transmembrane protein